jgi:protein-disulfide isomerase
LTSRLQSANRSDLIQSGARFSSAAVRSARRRAAIAMGIVSLLLILSVGFTTVARAQQAPATSAAAAPPKAKATASHAAAPSHAATAKPAGLPVKSYGSSGAPIKLEVFTDYQCPSCRSFFEMTLRPLINDYVATGKVYLVHHDYPLSGHQYSGMAARWANAAARVGEFGNVEGALYDNQTAWEMTGDVRKYVAAAIPAADFQRVEQQMQGCDGPGPTAPPPGQTATISYPPGGRPCTLDTFIAADVAIGLKVPVQATPTYRITYKGQTLPAASGAVSWPILKQFFDSLLAQ